MPHRLTISDKILARTILHLVPHSVTPNAITLARIISVPFVFYFFWVENYAVALPLFAVSAFSDALDGTVARARNMVTEFGKMFDPLADKLLVASVAIVIIPRFLGWGIAIAIIAIDLVLIFSAYFHKLYYNSKAIQAENSGKLKMVLQVCGIIALLVYALWSIPLLLILSQYLFYGAIIFALISLVVYRAI